VPLPTALSSGFEVGGALFSLSEGVSSSAGAAVISGGTEATGSGEGVGAGVRVGRGVALGPAVAVAGALVGAAVTLAWATVVWPAVGATVAVWASPQAASSPISITISSIRRIIVTFSFNYISGRTVLMPRRKDAKRAKD
jgi:hypothetical protein